MEDKDSSCSSVCEENCDPFLKCIEIKLKKDLKKLLHAYDY